MQQIFKFTFKFSNIEKNPGDSKYSREGQGKILKFELSNQKNPFLKLPISRISEGFMSQGFPDTDLTC